MGGERNPVGPARRASRAEPGIVCNPYPLFSGGAVLDHELINRTPSTAMRTGGEFAEVFVEHKRSFGGTRRWSGRGIDQRAHRGAGIRVVVGDTTGFAHTADLSEAGLSAAAEACRRLAVAVAGRRSSPSRRSCRTFGPGTNPARGRRQSDQGRLAHPRQRGRSGPGQRDLPGLGPLRRLPSPHPGRQPDGVLAEDDQVRTLFSVSCRERRHRSATGRESTGRTVGFELFDEADVEEMGDAAERAITKLSACPAPSGVVPVVVGPGGGGVLFHEACGHGLEADLVGKGASVCATVPASRSPPRWSRSSTTAPWPASGATSPSTTRAVLPATTS